MLTLERPTELPELLTESYSSLPPDGTYRMYALAFDLDTETLKNTYPNPSYTNGYADIRKILESEGFSRQQGSVYFGDQGKVTLTSCILAARRLAKELPWFLASVRDIRMLRIEETNDVLPLIQ
jgi:virulence-associated protein VapD